MRRCVSLEVAAVEPPAVEFHIEGCVHGADAGPRVAVFDWSNRTGERIDAPYGPGNQFVPGPAARGQGQTFPVGGEGRVVVPLDSAGTTWTLLDQSVSVTPDSPPCGDRCWQHDLWDGREDSCAESCGNDVCDDSETCRDCPADCDCTAIKPFADCVRRRSDGRVVVSFGYQNDANRGAIAMGPDNRVGSGAANYDQPTHFDPGEHHDVFVVTFFGEEPSWTVGAQSAGADATTPECVDDCGACTRGECVGTTCRASCGDGWCHGGCDECVDCACATGGVCLGGACGTIPVCGTSMECGIQDAYGVHVDCGPCPDGLVCVANGCFPICPGSETDAP